MVLQSRFGSSAFGSKSFACIDHMAQAPAEGEPTGPPQAGRGNNGQYVYWIALAHPKPETIELLELKAPTDFTRKSFPQLIVKAHAECNVQIMETVSFQGPRANGLPHHNAVVRAGKQLRWLESPEPRTLKAQILTGE